MAPYSPPALRFGFESTPLFSWLVPKRNWTKGQYSTPFIYQGTRDVTADWIIRKRSGSANVIHGWLRDIHPSVNPSPPKPLIRSAELTAEARPARNQISYPSVKVRKKARRSRSSAEAPPSRCTARTELS